MVDGMTRADLEVELRMLREDLEYFQDRENETVAEIDRISGLLNTPRKQRVRTARKATRTVTRSKRTTRKR